MAIWDAVIPAVDREIYAKAGFGRPPEWKGIPALVIVDALWAFIGHKRVEVLEAIDEYPTAAGKAGWDGLERIADLLDFFRRNRLPVVYVCATGDKESGSTTRHHQEHDATATGDAYEIPDLIAPQAGEPVLTKSKASAFFRTPLDVLLRKLAVDMVLLAGSTTCGCIRATAVDAHSLGFETVVLADAVWDRSPFSHAVSLFELHMKYASVLSSDDACAGLASYRSSETSRMSL